MNTTKASVCRRVYFFHCGPCVRACVRGWRRKKDVNVVNQARKKAGVEKKKSFRLYDLLVRMIPPHLFFSLVIHKPRLLCIKRNEASLFSFFSLVMHLMKFERLREKRRDVKHVYSTPPPKKWLLSPTAVCQTEAILHYSTAVDP